MVRAVSTLNTTGPLEWGHPWTSSRHLQLACADNKAHVGVCFVCGKRRLFKIKTVHCSFRLASFSLYLYQLLPRYSHRSRPTSSCCFPATFWLERSSLLQHFHSSEFSCQHSGSPALRFLLAFCSPCSLFFFFSNKMFASGCGFRLEERGFQRFGRQRY